MAGTEPLRTSTNHKYRIYRTFWNLTFWNLTFCGFAFLCVTYWRERVGEGGGIGQIIPRRESLVFYKSFNIVWPAVSIAAWNPKSRDAVPVGKQCVAWTFIEFTKHAKNILTFYITALTLGSELIWGLWYMYITLHFTSTSELIICCPLA